jgi:hypothetical protein
MVTNAVESLGTFGEVEDEEELEKLDAPPIPFTLVGYERESTDDGVHKRREFEFHALPTFEFGPYFATLSKVDARGSIPLSAQVQFLADALVPEEREQWDKTIRGSEIHFEASMLGEIVSALIDRYRAENVPTQSRSERRSGPRRTGATSGAKRSGRASTSSEVA